MARAKPHAKVRADRRVLNSDQLWADAIVARAVAACHPKQLAFVLDPGRRISALCARGAGKTTAGLARFVIRMVRTTKAKCLFVAQTQDDARDLIWDKLQDWVERFEIEADFNEGRLTCTFRRNGSQLKLVGADNDREVNKLRGKPRHEVGIDETAVFPAKRLQNIVHRAIGPRLGDYGGCMWMISTPGHILGGLYYDATRPGSDLHRRWEVRDQPEYRDWKKWSSHAWSLQDGAPHVPQIASLLAEALVEKETNGWSDDNPIWLREYCGQWAADDTENVFKYRIHVDGQHWNQWDPEMRIVGDLRIATLPVGPDKKPRTDWLYAIGIDHGSKDPFALNVFAASPSDPTRNIYHVLGFEQTQMYAQRIAVLLIGPEVLTNLDAAHDKPGGVIGAIGDWPSGMVADVAQLGQNILDELSQVYGVKVAPAEQKGKFSGIELVNGDLVDGRLKILKGSKLEEQLLSLQWVKDEFDFVKENKAQANHSSDTLIYARRLLANLFDSAGASAKPVPKRDTFADPMGLDSGPQPDSGPRGEFDSLFTESYDSLEF